MKKVITMFLLLVVAAGFAAAGGKTESGGATTIRMSWWGGEARHNATLSALEVFERQNPGIKVTPEYQGYEGYHEKVIAQLAGRTAPDIFQFNPEDIMTISGNGHAVDLNQFRGKGLDLTNVPESNLKDGTFDGKLYTIPLSLQTFCILLNKTKIEAAGMTIPRPNWTWDDYYSFVTQLQTRLPPGVYASNDLRMDADAAICYVHQQGGAMLTPSKEIKFAAYAGPFFSRFQDLMKAGIVPPMEESVTGPDQLFTEGRTLVTFNYNAMVDGLASEMADGNQVVLLPVPSSQDSKKLGMWVKGDIGLVINSRSKNTAEAVKLLNGFVNNTDMYNHLKLTRGVPPSTAVLEYLSRNMTPLEKLVLEMQFLAAESKDTPEARYYQGWSTQYQVIEDQVQNYAFGRIDLATALKNIEDNFRRELGR